MTQLIRHRRLQRLFRCRFQLYPRTGNRFASFVQDRTADLNPDFGRLWLTRLAILGNTGCDHWAGNLMNSAGITNRIYNFALALVAWTIVYLPVNVYGVSRLHRLSFAYAEASSQLRGKMVDTTANIDIVQHTGEGAFERRHVGESIGFQRASHLREWWWSEWLLVANGLMLAAFMVAMFGIGMRLITQGRISVGSLVMVVTVVIALEQRMFFLGQNLTQAVSYHGQVSEGLAELLQPHEITDRPGATQLVVRNAQIRFQALDFSYKNARVFAGDFDLAIQGGEKVGLVGQSGAGKSTLVSLLLRQFELDGGRILIDGQSVSEITLESLRRAVALVPQSNPFRRLVRSWKYADQKREHQKRLDEMYRNIPAEMRSRYTSVLQVAAAIRANYSQLSFASQVFATQMDAKLTGLLEGYVRLLYSAHTHREYLKSLNPEQVRSEAAFLEQSLAKAPAKVQEINQRRIEILRKRVAKFEKIRENSQVIEAQCSAIEDVLQLIRDQSVTMRDPQEVSAQLDHLVQDVEQTEQSVKEMEEIFALAAPAARAASTIWRTAE